MDVDTHRDSKHAFLRLWFVTDVLLIAVCCLRRRYSVSLVCCEVSGNTVTFTHHAGGFTKQDTREQWNGLS